jgi:hypothetical protein
MVEQALRAMNEKWRDYSKYTDKQLDDLLKGLAGEPDYAAVVFEYQRRQNARQEAENKSRHEKTQRLARWAMIFAALSVVGIVFGLIPCSNNKAPSNATHSEPSEKPQTEPMTSSTPEQTQQGTEDEPSEEPEQAQPEESPTPYR